MDAPHVFKPSESTPEGMTRMEKLFAMEQRRNTQQV
jgi:hypothetical protein